MTAARLLDLLRRAGCDPVADGWDLVLSADPPADLEPYLGLLHTGVRALLKGRRWFGLDDRGRGVGPLIDSALDPGRLLPASTRCLSVEGEIGAGWDVIGTGAADWLPNAFAVSQPPAKQQKTDLALQWL